jgi:hypothetical protein
MWLRQRHFLFRLFVNMWGFFQKTLIILNKKTLTITCPPLHDTFTFIICVYVIVRFEKVDNFNEILSTAHVSYPF